MSAPVRIRRSRTKGWRMPDGALYVGRPTRWGNPFMVGGWVTVHASDAERGYTVDLDAMTAAQAVAGYRDLLETRLTLFPGEDDDEQVVQRVRSWQAGLNELRGHDLVCWCPLDQPCHADVLLEVANQ